MALIRVSKFVSQTFSPTPPPPALGWSLFTRLELLLYELIEGTLLGQQSGVGSALGDDSVLHANDVVGVLNGAEPVRDDDGRPSLHELLQGLLNQPLVLGVEGARGLVEEKDLGLADGGPCDGDALLLADAELRPLFPTKVSKPLASFTMKS